MAALGTCDSSVERIERLLDHNGNVCRKNRRSAIEWSLSAPLAPAPHLRPHVVPTLLISAVDLFRIPWTALLLRVLAHTSD